MKELELEEMHQADIIIVDNEKRILATFKNETKKGNLRINIYTKMAWGWEHDETLELTRHSHLWFNRDEEGVRKAIKDYYLNVKDYSPIR